MNYQEGRGVEESVVGSPACSDWQDLRRVRLLTWLWGQEAAAVVIAAICTVFPQVTHPLQTPISSALAELSGPTKVCGHRGMPVSTVLQGTLSCSLEEPLLPTPTCPEAPTLCSIDGLVGG